MKLRFTLICVGLLATGCSPVAVAIPLAGPDGWMQMLSDSNAQGVPLLSMNW
ncbi:hypothetical protein [Litoreibacter halocynthiae]|uniref:hypothetical protein n=1 Tax=Litoreibacter halocynthiae TaxID=1242689 RepID=UPI002493492D|nr:hypothetical protein [Litoreibacter halocynthiae]